MRVKFFPAAEREMIEAAHFYELRLRGLGLEFVKEVERVGELLTELPLLGERLDPLHRRVPLRRFPYAIIFRHDGEIVHIVAVAHRRRKPRYWDRECKIASQCGESAIRSSTTVEMR